MTELLVVGAGPAGVAAARTGARLGARVTLVERAGLGGTCVHAGCIPSAAFHRSAELADEVSQAPATGVRASLDGVDWPAAQGWVGTVVRRATALTRTSLESAGVELVTGTARFTGPARIEAGGRVFEGVPVVLAGGAASFVPDLEGPFAGRVLSNTEAMALERPPGSLLVAGAERFGLEWADLFSRLGSRVTVAVAHERVLPAEDADVAGFLQLLLEQRGIGFLLGRPAPPAGTDAEAILFADARRPLTAELGLEAAGVRTDDAGAVAVDPGCRTSAPGIFAAGDLTGPPWLSNRAQAMGRVAAANALGGSARVRPERLPRSVNTRPELAAVGLTEEQARARGLQVGVGFGELAASLRAITLGEDRGALKIVVDAEFGEILGAHMVGVGATEVMALVTTAMELEADYRDLARISHLHPSLAELVTDAIESI